MFILDIVCKKGKLFKKILVGEGDSYGFYTQHPKLNTYAPNTKCFVSYKVGNPYSILTYRSRKF